MKIGTGFVCTVVLVGIAAASNARPAIECANPTAIKEAFLGEDGEYEVKQGLQTQKRRSLLKRKKLTPTDGCFLGTFQSNDKSCFVVQLDKKLVGDSFDCSWQCVESGNPGNEFAAGRTNSGYDKANLVGVGGQDLGSGSVPTLEKFDSGTKYNDDLAAKGLVHTSYCLNSPYNKYDKYNGKTIFCQCFDTGKGKPWYSWEYKYEAK